MRRRISDFPTTSENLLLATNPSERRFPRTLCSKASTLTASLRLTKSPLSLRSALTGPTEATTWAPDGRRITVSSCEPVPRALNTTSSNSPNGSSSPRVMPPACNSWTAFVFHSSETPAESVTIMPSSIESSTDRNRYLFFASSCWALTILDASCRAWAIACLSDRMRTDRNPHASATSQVVASPTKQMSRPAAWALTIRCKFD